MNQTPFRLDTHTLGHTRRYYDLWILTFIEHNILVISVNVCTTGRRLVTGSSSVTEERPCDRGSSSQWERLMVTKDSRILRKVYT